MVGRSNTVKNSTSNFQTTETLKAEKEVALSHVWAHSRVCVPPQFPVARPQHKTCSSLLLFADPLQLVKEFIFKGTLESIRVHLSAAATLFYADVCCATNYYH